MRDGTIIHTDKPCPECGQPISTDDVICRKCEKEQRRSRLAVIRDVLNGISVFAVAGMAIVTYLHYLEARSERIDTEKAAINASNAMITAEAAAASATNALEEVIDLEAAIGTYLADLQSQRKVTFVGFVRPRELNYFSWAAMQREQSDAARYDSERRFYFTWDLAPTSICPQVSDPKFDEKSFRVFVDMTEIMTIGWMSRHDYRWYLPGGETIRLDSDPTTLDCTAWTVASITNQFEGNIALNPETSKVLRDICLPAGTVVTSRYTNIVDQVGTAKTYEHTRSIRLENEVLALDILIQHLAFPPSIRRLKSGLRDGQTYPLDLVAAEMWGLKSELAKSGEWYCQLVRVIFDVKYNQDSLVGSRGASQRRWVDQMMNDYHYAFDWYDSSDRRKVSRKVSALQLEQMRRRASP